MNIRKKYMFLLCTVKARTPSFTATIFFKLKLIFFRNLKGQCSTQQNVFFLRKAHCGYFLVKREGRKTICQPLKSPSPSSSPAELRHFGFTFQISKRGLSLSSSSFHNHHVCHGGGVFRPVTPRNVSTLEPSQIQEGEGEREQP